MKYITAGDAYGAPGGDSKGHSMTSHAEEEDL